MPFRGRVGEDGRIYIQRIPDEELQKMYEESPESMPFIPDGCKKKEKGKK